MTRARAAMTAAETGHEACRARGLDVVLSGVTIVLVGLAASADLGEGVGPGPVAYGFAVGLGGLLLIRRRFPVTVLVATSVGLIIYYRLGQPPVGLAVPMVAALFSAAEQGVPGGRPPSRPYSSWSLHRSAPCRVTTPGWSSATNCPRRLP